MARGQNDNRLEAIYQTIKEHPGERPATRFLVADNLIEKKPNEWEDLSATAPSNTYSRNRIKSSASGEKHVVSFKVSP